MLRHHLLQPQLHPKPLLTEEDLDYTFETNHNEYEFDIEYDDIDWEEATVVVEEWSPTSKNSTLSGIVYNNYNLEELSALSGLSEDEITELLMQEIATQNGIKNINIIYDGDEITLANPYALLGIDIEDDEETNDANATQKGTLAEPVTLDGKAPVETSAKDKADTQIKWQTPDYKKVYIDGEVATIGETDNANSTPKGVLAESVAFNGEIVTRTGAKTPIGLPPEYAQLDDIATPETSTTTLASTGEAQKPLLGDKLKDNQNQKTHLNSGKLEDSTGSAFPFTKTACQYYGKHASDMFQIMNFPIGSAWCAKFVNFVINNTEEYKVPEWYTKVENTDRCTRILKAAQENDAIINPADVQPGDLMLQEWDINDHSGEGEGVDHVGIVVSNTKDEEGNIVITTIEGNALGKENASEVRYMQYIIDENNKIEER